MKKIKDQLAIYSVVERQTQIPFWNEIVCRDSYTRFRKHQEGMEGDYSGRTFDTKFVRPFIKSKFPYYILTTHEPNFNDYMRLMSNPQDMIDVYTQQLEFEYQRASGIKREHLRVWQEIRRSVLGME